jgi:hypothetical protein
MNILYQCLECGNSITLGVYDFSREVHGVPLCLKHQNWFNESMASPETVSLYFALKSNNLPVKLEFWDGKNTIDIAIPDKLYIEVDANQHNDAEQALTDFLRTFHSGKDKIPTFRISNAHIRNSYHFEIIVDKLTDLCKEIKKTG